MLFDWCDFCQGSMLRSSGYEFNDAAWKKAWLVTPTLQRNSCLAIARISGFNRIDFKSKHLGTIHESPRTSSVDSSETSPSQTRRVGMTGVGRW
jgi:hypothetical protein